jgi:hypothetical protein
VRIQGVAIQRAVSGIISRPDWPLLTHEQRTIQIEEAVKRIRGADSTGAIQKLVMEMGLGPADLAPNTKPRNAWEISSASN